MGMLNWSTPVDPSAEQARQWAREELAKEPYRRAQPGLVDRFLTWLFEELNSLSVRGPDLAGANVAWALLLGSVVLIVALVLFRTGRLRGPGRVGASAQVFSDRKRSAAEYRQRADQAAAREDWDTACCERFRAVVQSLHERTLLEDRPGRTADEAARQAGGVLPLLARELQSGAHIFDEIRYGKRLGNASQDAQLRSLDTAVAQSRPSFADVPVVSR